MAIQIKRINRQTKKTDNLLTGMTALQDGAVNSLTIGVTGAGAIILVIAGKETRVDLGFVPAKFGAGAMGSKGWMRFTPDPIA